MTRNANDLQTQQSIPVSLSHPFQSRASFSLVSPLLFLLPAPCSSIKIVDWTPRIGRRRQEPFNFVVPQGSFEPPGRFFLFRCFFVLHIAYRVSRETDRSIHIQVVIPCPKKEVYPRRLTGAETISICSPGTGTWGYRARIAAVEVPVVEGLLT